ncbi:MAG: VacJ family lipoprotein [Gammaproteobacteria bacterium]
MIRPASALFALIPALLAGCASQPNVKKDPRDPLESFNRASYKFNDALDRAVLKPVAKGYKAIAPQFVETGVSNFFSNLEQPTVIVNDLLQAKFKPALSDTGRFLMNTTIGLGGLLDPASAAGLDRNDEDFGQTLGKWGVPSGPYLMVPFFGPSTFRDGVGSGADVFTDPVHYVERDAIRYSLDGVGLINMRAQLLQTEEALSQTYDKYAFIRNVYLQRREFLVTDGAVAPAPVDDEPLEDPEPDADKK